MSGGSPYAGLTERCAKLDGRNTKYQFDLEADVAWDRLHDTGDYFGSSLLGALGIDVGALRRVPEAWTLFQWAFALSTCQDFIALEELILRFSDAEAAHLGETRSLDLLVEEERKHIELFRRYGQHLRAHAPGGQATCDAFDKVYGDTPMILTRRLDAGEYPDAATHHYLFWLTTVFFEDFTIYLHERLSSEASGLQPAWLSAHAAHRREEEQHVVTDMAYIDALELPAEQRARWSMLFYIWMTENAERFFGLDTPQKLVSERYPQLRVRLVDVLAEAPFFDDLLFHKLFRRTRQAAPYIERLREAAMAPPEQVERPAEAPPSPSSAQAASPPLSSLLRRRASELIAKLRDRAAGARSPMERFRPATPLPEPPPPGPDDSGEPTVAEMTDLVRAVWADVLEVPVDRIAPDTSFVTLGGDSQRAVEMLSHLERELGRFLDHRLLIECRTPGEAGAFLCRELTGLAAAMPTVRVSAPTPAVQAAPRSRDIAIVAMDGRFGGATELDSLWRLVASGDSALREVPAERWEASRFYDPRPGAPGKTMCKRGGFVDDIESFDPAAFGLTDADVIDMDPQQRLFLETAANLLDSVDTRTRRIGVFSGAGWNDYMLRHVMDPRLIGSVSALGNMQHMVAARVSQRLGLEGPALNVAAACATSLVAVHLACHSVRAGECDMAIAGGVELYLTPTAYILFSQAGVLSASGHCRPFCSEADGFVPGEGVGAVLLESVERARALGHPIVAVIRGSAMNNDGGGLSGMAPSPKGQLAVLRAAYSDAGVDPATVSFVEAHGTGTAIGDPIEVRALSQLFSEAGCRPGDVALGSVKANIGHTFTTAGVAGLIKAALCMQHGVLPGIAGHTGEDRRIDFASTPLRPLAGTEPWPERDGQPRRAGVSAFGIGGTNCHVVLEAAPPVPTDTPSRDRAQLLCMSAPTVEDLERVAAHHLRTVSDAGREGFADVVAGLGARASRFAIRSHVVAHDPDSLADAVRDMAAGRRTQIAPKVAFAFSGPGSQFPDMARELWECEPAFTEALKRCSDILEPLLPLRLEDYLYREREPTNPGMNRIDITQPVVFSVGYALAVWLRSLGVVPNAVLGHSAGEYIAACVAGVLDLESALTLVTRRGQCMSRSAPGKMAAALTGEARVRDAIERCGRDVGIAAINGPGQIVISGDGDAVDAVSAALERDGVVVRVLPISCAAHSPLMSPVQPALAEYAEAIDPTVATIPFYSTVTGKRVAADAILDRGYWVDHLRAPVQFAAAVDAAAAAGYGVILEVGASGGLTHSIESIVGERAQAIPLMRRKPSGWHSALSALGRLFECGVDVDVARVNDGRVGAVAVPPYPYAKRVLWLDAPGVSGASVVAGGPQVVDVSDEPAVLDHVVRGEPIAPAALLIELAREATEAHALRDVIIGRPLGVGDGRRVARVRVSGDEQDAVFVESRGAGAGSWVEHLSARLDAEGDGGVAGPLDVAAIRDACDEVVEPDSIYHRLDATGLVYGLRMRAVRRLWRRREDGAPVEVLAELVLPEGASRGGVLEPAIVDGAMQSIAGLIADASHDEDDEPMTYLGFAMGRVTIAGPTPEVCVARVQLRSRLTPGIESFRCDVTIAREDGAVVAQFDQVGLKRMRMRSPVHTAAVLWEPTPAGAPRAEDRPSAVVLVRGPGEEARSLARALRRRCEDAGVHVLEAAAPTDLESAHSLIRRVAPVESVLAVDLPVLSLLALARAVADDGVDELAAFTVVGGDAAATGFVRVLDREYPRWRCMRIELDAAARVDGETPRRIVDDLWSGEERVVIAYRDGDRLAPTLAVVDPAGEGAPWRDAGVYWITGGMGGIGRSVGEFLGRKFGARLLVTGRRAAPDPEALAALEAAGAEVRYAQADVCDAEAMAAARDSALAAWGEIHGVMHAAGLLDDELVRTRDLDRAGRVLAPKVAGARVVRDITAELPLDFVAFFSSLAALAGGPGQSDYAAGNAYMDALALDMDRDGRVVTINWGPWREVGMVADEALQKALASQGIVALSPREGVRALTEALARSERQLVVTGLAPGLAEAMNQHFNRRAGAAVLELEPEDDDGPPPPVRDYLRRQLARALRVSPGDVDLEASLVRLGVDSLMAVEMVKRLERRYAVRLYPTLLFEHETLGQVADYVVELVAEGGAQLQLGESLVAEVDIGGVDAYVVGGEPGLHRVRVQDPEPGEGELAIEVVAAGVNFIDVLATTGMHPLLGGSRFVPGHEVAGRVCAVGEGVDQFAVGDRVMAIVRHGGYARRVVTPAPSVVAIPQGISAVQAASCVITGLTAIACVEQHGRVRSGDRVLVQAAAGGTGTACVELARHLGAELFGTAGAPEKLERLRALGVHHPINYRNLAFDDAVRGVVGDEGIDVVIDSLSGDAITKGLALLRPGGRFIEIGAAGVIEAPTVDPRDLFARDITFAGCNVGHLERSPVRLRAHLARLVELLETGVLSASVGHTVPFEEAVRAHGLLRNRENLGKVVLVLDEAAE